MLAARHTAKIQKKISLARVTIAGLGGLGSNIAVALTRMGIGELRLIDFDRVELSNLNRQQYGIRHLGQQKTDALREVISEINPYVKVEADCVRITEENAAELLCMERFICEAFDVPENKAMLVNTLLSQCPDCIIVAASGMAGYGSANDIITKRTSSRLYLSGDGVTDLNPQAYGLMAPRVAICANHQANMVLRLILDQTNP
jgi:sulfur carrier protein ThiS adenylyltransferase